MSHPHFLWKDLFRHRKDDKHTLIEVLKENVLFCTLTPRELKYLSHFVYERVYQPQENIFQQNDRGFGMYIIVKGSVNIKTNAGDEEVLVTTLEQGSFFGELSLIETDSLRTASVEAKDRSIVIGFFKPDLMEIIERKPEMGVKILFQLSSVLGRRLLETTEKITSLSQTNHLIKKHEEVI